MNRSGAASTAPVFQSRTSPLLAQSGHALVALHMSAFGGKADIEGQGARRLRGALRGAEVINSLMIEPRENFETWLMIWTAANVVSFREGGAFK